MFAGGPFARRDRCRGCLSAQGHTRVRVHAAFMRLVSGCFRSLREARNETLYARRRLAGAAVAVPIAGADAGVPLVAVDGEQEAAVARGVAGACEAAAAVVGRVDVAVWAAVGRRGVGRIQIHHAGSVAGVVPIRGGRGMTMIKLASVVSLVLRSRSRVGDIPFGRVWSSVRARSKLGRHQSYSRTRWGIRVRSGPSVRPAGKEG